MRIALSFLTRLPVGQIDEPDYLAALGRSTPWFPLVGLAVGAVVAAADAAAGLWLGPLGRSAVAILAGAWVTGALHLDGLMDTADGVLSHRSRERMLEIMKDSRSGAMGVVAGVLSLMLRFAFLAETPLRWQALLLAPALGRTAIALAAGFWPPARPAGSGLGSSFAAHVGRRRALLACGAAAILAACIGVAATLLHGYPVWPEPSAVDAWALGVLTLGAWALSLTVAVLLARFLSARLGGLTGDTYGAINEAAELAVLALYAGGVGL